LAEESMAISTNLIHKDRVTHANSCFFASAIVCSSMPWFIM
jgi:hypothetical protein